MSNKHFLPNNTNNIAPYCLRAVTYQYPFLSLLDREKVVFNNKFDRRRVALISGGGSGHEPGFYGLVGTGMLSAVAHGDVFASPNYRNVKAAEKVCHELGGGPGSGDDWGGVIFILTNYTGDNLYFGMAAQDLIARYGPDKVRILRVTDDVAVSRSAGALVGRRTLAGIAVVSKLTGAASQLGHAIDDVYALGQAAIDSTASVNAGLDHVHISGHNRDEDFGKLRTNELEIGLGIHNEPGVEKLQYIPKNEELVPMLLRMILDENDKERGFFKRSAPADKIVLFINNLGGVPTIEEKALLYTTVQVLRDAYGISPVRIYTGNFVTSFNAQIFTISLFNATTTAAASAFSTEQIFAMLDMRTDAVCWPNTVFTNGLEPINTGSSIITNFAHYDDDTRDSVDLDFHVDPVLLEKIIRTAAERVVAKEPELTDWDTKMGDGDCGHGLKAGADIVLQKLTLDKFAASGDVLLALHVVLGVIKDDMGGTLGAIIFIFLRSVLSRVEEKLKDTKGQTTLPEAFAEGLLFGLTTLFDYTKARKGHRTVMDVLIPFVESFASSKDIHEAVKVAHDAAEHTRKLKPKLGRATYVGGVDNKTDFPPDPGAYGIYEAISALDV